MTPAFSTTVRVILYLLVLSAPLSSYAQRQYAVLTDNDRNSATGCIVTLPFSGTEISGVESRLTAFVSGQPPEVTAVELEHCVDGAFDPPVAQPGSFPYPVAYDPAPNADVVEIAVKASELDSLDGLIRLYFIAQSDSDDDLLATTDGSATGEPILFYLRAVSVIPLLNGWGLLILALLLVAAVLWWRKTRGYRALGGVLLLSALGIGIVIAAAPFIADGELSDWVGETPIATEPADDATPPADLVQAFVGDNLPQGRALVVRDLVFRIDVLANRGPLLDAIEPGALVYTENDPATPISNTLTVTDLNDTELQSAVVQIGTNCTFPQDILVFTDQNGISGAYTPASCTLSLSGASSVANYQSALRSVAYQNSSENPSEAERTVSFTVNDGEFDSNTLSRAINVLSVNDAPSFTPGPDQSIDDVDGAQNIANWATNISPGPAEESGQSVQFIVTSSTDPTLFSVQPAIAPNGTLSYTPASPAEGTATITVVLQDDGGTANGGVDTSAPVSFDIQINLVRAGVFGYKFEDLNGNGSDDGEPPLADVQITLSGSDSFGNAVNLTTTTDAGGAYAFENLIPSINGVGGGSGYTVTETVPVGHVATTTVSVTLDLASGELASAETGLATIGAKQFESINPALAFGNTIPGSIHGFKFEDIDADGVYNNATDVPLADVEFVLTGSDGLGNAVNVSTTTDANGEFGFEDLLPSAAYTVSETVPAGHAATTPASFTGALQSGEELVAFAGQAMLGPGDPRVEVVIGAALMFGNTVPGSIHGFTFEDRDADGAFEPLCIAPDNGGTVQGPLSACALATGPGGPLAIIDGLPPGTTVDIDALLHSFINLAITAGGGLSGETEQFDASFRFVMRGSGDLAGFERIIELPVAGVADSAPRTPGDPGQTFASDLFQLQGALFGDPDFDVLQITIGTAFGLPSPGQATLSDLGGGNFQVDSFFDITYQIDFVGAPGGALDGLSGSTTGTVRIDSLGDRLAGGIEVTLSGTDGMGNAVGPIAIATNNAGEFRFGNLTPGVYQLAQTTPASAGDTTPNPITGIALQSREELVAFAGQAMLPPGDPRIEVLDPALLFGHAFVGIIKVIKTTLPGGGAGFGFTDDIQAPNSFSLADTQMQIFTVAPGVYTIGEDDPSGLDYQLTDITIVDASGGSSANIMAREALLDVASGETVTVTFTNTELGTIVIIKDAVPDDPTDFTFSDNIQAPNTFTLDDDADAALPNSITFNALPGAYTVTESDPLPGYLLAALSCDDATDTSTDLGTRTASIGLSSGETVTCRFTNIPAVPPSAVDDPNGGLPANSTPASHPYHTALNTALMITDSADDLLANDTLGSPAAALSGFGALQFNDGAGALLAAIGAAGANSAGSTVDFSTLGVAGISDGSLTVVADGGFTFVPPTNYTGLFIFQYQLSNSVSSSTATVTLAVGERPACVNDSYSATGNIAITIDSANGVILGTGADSGSLVAVSEVQGAGANVATATNTNQTGLGGVAGSVTLNSNGSFSYDPPPGFTGADDTLSYRVGNGFGNTAPCTVTIALSDIAWFIQNNAGGSNRGTFLHPFTSIASFNSANAAGANQPQAGDHIALRTGSGSYSETDGINLLNSQILIGEAVQFNTQFTANANSVGAYQTFAGGTNTAPQIITSAGNGIDLASGNTIRGLDIGNTSGTGIIGTNVGTATVSDTGINGTGAGINITTGTLAMSFDEISSSNAAGIVLSNVNGTFNVTTGTINSGSATAVNIDGNPSVALGVTLTSVSSDGGSAPGISLTDTTSTLMITGTGTTSGSGGTIKNKSNDAVILNNTDGRITFKNMIIEDIGDNSGPIDTRSQDDGIHGQQVDGGVTLDNTIIRRVSDMCINGALLSDGIGATVWTGLEILNGSLIEDCNRFHVTGVADSSDEGSVRIVGLNGIVTVDNSILRRGGELMDIFTTTSGTLTMTIQRSQFLDAYKEFTSGSIASIGKAGIDVTVRGSTNAVVRIGDETMTALGNTFVNNATASIRIGHDSTADSGDLDVLIANNTFRVTDHSSTLGTAANFPQGGVSFRPRAATGTGDLIFANNTFGSFDGSDSNDEVMNADGGLGNLTLIMDGGDIQAEIRGNTFNGPINAPYEIRADANDSALLLIENNTYNGRDDFFSPDPFFGTFNVPGIASKFNVRNGGSLTLTHRNEDFRHHETRAGLCLDCTTGTSVYSTNSSGGTLNLFLSNLDLPNGFDLNHNGGTLNLFDGTSTSPTVQGVLNDNLNTGGDAPPGTNVFPGTPGRTPPEVNVTGTVTLQNGTVSLPNITIP